MRSPHRWHPFHPRAGRRYGPGSDHQKQDWTSQVSGCDGLIEAIYPGLAYDPVQDKMVGWAGGDTIYLFDPDTKSCTTVEWTGGPGPQNPNGTMGRFRYLESLNVFVVVNDWQQDSYTPTADASLRR